MTTEHVTVTPKQASKAILDLLLTKIPIILWGQVGIGKSSLTAQAVDYVNANKSQFGLAFDQEFKFVDIRASQLESVDVRGLPSVENGQTIWNTPEFLPTSGQGILFFDEVNRAAVSVQNALLQLFLGRQLGKYHLPDNWFVVAACNYETDGGGINRMTSALSNRAINLDLVPDIKDSTDYFVSKGVDPMVIAFLRYRPELLHQFDKRARSFPTPRSWEFVSNLLAGSAAKLNLDNNKDNQQMLAYLAATVGKGAAMEFLAFIKLYKALPSIDAILLNPSAVAVPNDPATMFAISTALGRVANDASFAAILQYTDRLPEEYQVLCVRDAIGHDNTLANTPEFTSWSQKNQHVHFGG